MAENAALWSCQSWKSGADTGPCPPSFHSEASVTRRSGSRYGSGLRSTVLTTLKTAVLAPMPSAMTSTATLANTDFCVACERRNADLDPHFGSNRSYPCREPFPSGAFGCRTGVQPCSGPLLGSFPWPRVPSPAFQCGTAVRPRGSHRALVSEMRREYDVSKTLFIPQRYYRIDS